MKKVIITTNLELKWQFKSDYKYKLSTCGKLYNEKTNRLISKTINGGYSYGFWINRKFYTLKNLKENNLFELTKKTECPF